MNYSKFLVRVKSFNLTNQEKKDFYYNYSHNSLTSEELEKYNLGIIDRLRKENECIYDKNKYKYNIELDYKQYQRLMRGTGLSAKEKGCIWQKYTNRGLSSVERVKYSLDSKVYEYEINIPYNKYQKIMKGSTLTIEQRKKVWDKYKKKLLSPSELKKYGLDKDKDITNNNTRMDLTTMSKDVMVKMGLDMDYEDVVSLCKTNKKLNAFLCKNEYFWKQKYEKEFGKVKFPTFKEMYSEKYSRNKDIVEVLNNMINFNKFSFWERKKYYKKFKTDVFKIIDDNIEKMSETLKEELRGVVVGEPENYSVSSDPIQVYLWNFNTDGKNNPMFKILNMGRTQDEHEDMVAFFKYETGFIRDVVDAYAKEKNITIRIDWEED